MSEETLRRRGLGMAGSQKYGIRLSASIVSLDQAERCRVTLSGAWIIQNPREAIGLDEARE
jgi:hypothetical protein